MSGRAAVAALAIGSVAWFALVVLAPDLPPVLAAAVYGLGGVVCHQRPERSFHWHGAQLAVCARCTGIYLSLIHISGAHETPEHLVCRLLLEKKNQPPH